MKYIERDDFVQKIEIAKFELEKVLFEYNSLDKACEIFNCSKTKIQKTIKEYELPQIKYYIELKHKNIINDYLNNSNMSYKEISNKYHIHERSIFKILKKNNIPTRSEIESSNIYINIKKNLELYYYLFGLISADGYLFEKKKSIEISLYANDYELLKLLSILIYGKDNTLMDIFNKGSSRIRFFIYNSYFYNDLKTFGLTQNKSSSLNIDLNQIPKEYFKDFLRGYIDGDGSFIKKYKNSIYVWICGNKDTMYKLQEYINKYYNITPNVYLVDKSKNVSFDFYRMAIQRTEDAIKLIKILYNNSNIYLKRKFEIIATVL